MDARELYKKLFNIIKKLFSKTKRIEENFENKLLKQYGDAHDGLKGITQYIYKNHIPLHIHGHLHEENEEILKNGTKSIGVYKVKVLEI